MNRIFIFFIFMFFSLPFKSASFAENADLPRLAALQLINNAELSAHEASYLTDLLRRIVSDQLKGRVSVMTQENIRVMLPPDKRLEDCIGECEVDTGRLLGVDFILTGSIIKFGAAFRLTIRLHEVRKGELLGTEVAGAQDIFALEREVQIATQKLTRQLLGGAKKAGVISSEPVYRATNEAEVPIVTYGGGARLIAEFKSNPPGAAITVDGTLRCSEGEPLCRIEIEEGSHDISMAKKNYFEKRASLYIDRSKSKAEWALEPNFIEVQIIPIPSALKYEVDGISYQGVTSLQMSPGIAHRVQSVDPCFSSYSEDFKAQAGQSIQIKLAPKPLMSGIDVSVFDQNKKPIAAEVLVDNVLVGTSPLRHDVSSCAQKITARYGDVSKSESLYLKSGRSSRLDLTLITEQAVIKEKSTDNWVVEGSKRVYAGLLTGTSPFDYKKNTYNEIQLGFRYRINEDWFLFALYAFGINFTDRAVIGSIDFPLLYIPSTLGFGKNFGNENMASFQIRPLRFDITDDSSDGGTAGFMSEEIINNATRKPISLSWGAISFGYDRLLMSTGPKGITLLLSIDLSTPILTKVFEYSPTPTPRYQRDRLLLFDVKSSLATIGIKILSPPLNK